ncbi:MAG: NHL repeat-containing protein [Elusimicrobia bacterium]|nr:NHL repeat-containing protein [Elusimicrobiota bacterium]
MAYIENVKMSAPRWCSLLPKRDGTVVAMVRSTAKIIPFLVFMSVGNVENVLGHSADNILGQMDDSDNPVYTYRIYNYRPSDRGFYYPYSVAVDTSSHRLFIADYNNHRVLAFDMDSSNNLSDRVADHVLGKSGFNDETSGGTNQYNLVYPVGLAYDPGGQRLFVSERDTDRVLVFDAASLSDGENAVNVLGQSNFTAYSNSCQQNRLDGARFLDYDGVGNQLFVADQLNNRVLVFDVASVTDGENAVFVLGQPDYTTKTANTTQSGLSGPYGVKLATSTQMLYVAEATNNRVVVYDASALSNGMNASYVIGQSAFTTNTAAATQSGFDSPQGLAYDPATDQLFVSDFNSSRVLVFDVATNSNGPNAVNVIGQADFTSAGTGVAKNRFQGPYGLAMDEGNSRLYVADCNIHRIFFHDISSISDGQNASDGLGLQDGSGGYMWTRTAPNNPPNSRGLTSPYGVALDTSSHRLFVSDGNNSRVLVFDLDANNAISDRVADHVLGQSGFDLSVSSATQNRMNYSMGLDYDLTRQRLFVSDNGNNRILIFDLSGGLSDGQNATHVLGQSNFTNSSSGTSQSRMSGPRGIAYDSFTDQLFVAAYGNNRVMVFDVSTATVTNGENASYVLGQPDFATTTSGAAQNKMYYPIGVSVDLAGRRLFVSDTNARVLIFDVASITNGENALNVLGQADFTSSGLATDINRMNAPREVEYDPESGRLYVAEYSNNRVLVFDVTTVTDGENAVDLIGQANYTANAYSTTQTGLYGPTSLVVHPSDHRLFVGDLNNNRIVSYSMDLAPSTSTVSALPGAGAGQVDLSWASAGDEAGFGPLTGTYRIQYATYTVSWSTSSTPTDATTVTVATTSAVPGSAESYTVTGLTVGTTYYFVLWTADEIPNWSEISNTTSAVPSGWFDTNQIEVDGAGGGSFLGTWPGAITTTMGTWTFWPWATTAAITCGCIKTMATEPSTLPSSRWTWRTVGSIWAKRSGAISTVTGTWTL